MSTVGNNDFSTELVQAVGLVILEAAAAEDTIGELIVLRLGHSKSSSKWWTSGELLVAALNTLNDPELDPISKELKRLYPERNDVVHSLWLERRSHYLQMTRGKSTRKHPTPPSYKMRWGSGLDRLSRLAADFRTLELMASDAVSDAMGLSRSSASGLPQRLRPVVLPSPTE